MPEGSSWTFLTSHGFVLLEVARRPDATVREISEQVGLTERQAHRILGDLVSDGFVERERVGRRNRYRVDPSVPMRHPLLAHQRVGELLALLRRP